jgi:hypothetical protein
MGEANSGKVPEISTTRRLLLQICMAATVLAGANVLIARMAKNSMPRQVIRAIDANPQATVLATGNSLMAAGFNPDEFLQSWESNPAPARPATVMPLNIALGASGTVEQLLLLRRAFSRDSDVNMVLYGFFDLQLTEKPTGGWSDLVGNRAMAYYVEPYFAADMYAPGSRLQSLQVGLISHVPMLVERLTLWANVEKTRRRIGEIGMPREKTNEFGRAGDFTAMEFADTGLFESLCTQFVKQHLPFTPSVESMIDQAQQHHAKFVFIEMPMPTRHRTRFYQSRAWDAYRSHTIALATERHCLFIDASKWVEEGGFADALHLAPGGAIVFSKRLANETKNKLVRPDAE